MKVGHTHTHTHTQNQSKKRVKAPKLAADGPAVSSPLRDVMMLDFIRQSVR